MKIIEFLLLLLALSACSRSTYYAYEDEQSYCTIELTPKRRFLNSHPDYVIYRAISKQHYDTVGVVDKYVQESERYNTKKNVVYLYIQNDNLGNDSTIYIEGFFTMFYIPSNTINRFQFCTSIHEPTGSTNWRYTYFAKRIDSLVLIETTDLDEDHCFKRTGVDWFPPYLVEVNKIEYEKFQVKNISKKYLHYPNRKSTPFYDSEWEKKRKKREEKAKKKKN
ncbi:hypothetical protein [Bernardetia sp. MNP-M8]|uniref:hypothetical protein n=1 Tax=Bernardetia sp. MNP-M8 TaxID=3127470 RepID=UPI0030CC5785